MLAHIDGFLWCTTFGRLCTWTGGSGSREKTWKVCTTTGVTFADGFPLGFVLAVLPAFILNVLNLSSESAGHSSVLGLCWLTCDFLRDFGLEDRNHPVFSAVRLSGLAGTCLHKYSSRGGV